MKIRKSILALAGVTIIGCLVTSWCWKRSNSGEVTPLVAVANPPVKEVQDSVAIEVAPIKATTPPAQEVPEPVDTTPGPSLVTEEASASFAPSSVERPKFVSEEDFRKMQEQGRLQQQVQAKLAK